MPNYQREWNDSAASLDQLVRYAVEAEAGSQAFEKRALMINARIGILQADQAAQLAETTQRLVEAMKTSEDHAQDVAAATGGLKWATWALALFAAVQVLVQALAFLTT